MPTSTVENYLKEIFLVSEQESVECVPMGEVARALKVVPGTATTMVKHLAQQGYLEYTPRVGVKLTATGRSIALGMLRRHRLIEYFLVETLGLPWDEIHDEAERLEHAISDDVLDALDGFLGHPASDPHGDPIPSAQGELKKRATRTLSGCPVGTQTAIARILDQESAFLRFADQRGLRPGAQLTVLERTPETDAMVIQTSERDPAIPLSLSAAEKIRVWA